jgi:hypothetical protein
MSMNQCISNKVDGDVLSVSVNIDCLFSSFMQQLPVKTKEYRLEGNVLKITVVLDVEKLLNATL